MQEIKSFVRKVLPISIINLIINLIHKPINNYFNTKYKKKALLSYIVYPFRKTSISHTNYYEAQTWAKVLDELGYQVDIVQYNYSLKNLDITQYDLICGFGDAFQTYFESNQNNKATTIYYGTGMHVCYQNQATLKRVQDVYHKKGVWLGKSARFVEKTWTHQTTLVDGIIALGNDVCAESYIKYYDGKVLSVNAPFFQTQNPHNILKNKSKDANKHFLWFGSSGLIHKGLDLLLDFFSNHKDLNLHICGHIKKESDFVEVYKKELFEMNNIITHDFIDINSIKFRKILEQCSFIIYPSCSEGGSPSVVTCVGNGGLIPIVHKYTTFNTGYEIFIESLNYDGIKNAVNKAVSLKQADIDRLSLLNLKYVLENHSKELYKKNLKLSILDIIGDDDAV